jgi:hypothetical protein
MIEKVPGLVGKTPSINKQWVTKGNTHKWKKRQVRVIYYKSWLCFNIIFDLLGGKLKAGM